MKKQKREYPAVFKEQAISLLALDQGVVPDIEVVDVRGEAQKSHWTSQ